MVTRLSDRMSGIAMQSQPVLHYVRFCGASVSVWESVCLSGLFSLCIWFWTEAAVGSHLAQPPSHTEGLQYCSDVMFLRLLFVCPLRL